MLSQIEGYRLSPQQKRVWALQEGNDVYRATGSVSLTGPLTPEAIKAALLQVINRHEILRTTFRRVPGIKVPLQVVAEAGVWTWEVLDLQGQSTPEQEALVLERFQAIGRAAFDYEQGPLLHAWLIRRSASEHVLLLCLPALTADAWTLKNLAREIAAACVVDRAEAEVVQYAQFSEWQHELLEGEDAEPGQAYWREQDFSALAGLSLPYEIKVAERPPFDPQVFSIAIDPNVAQALAESAPSIKLSLLAAWQVLLWRLTRQPDLVIGVSCTGRNFEDLEAGLGLFAKVVPIRSHVEAAYPFSKILRQTQQSLTQAEEWQSHFLWEESLGSAGLAEGYPCAFEWETRAGPGDNAAPAAPETVGRLSFSLGRAEVCSERFKIKLVGVQAGESLTAEWHYDAGLFSVESIHCLAEQYQVLLASAAQDREARVRALALSSEAVRHHLRVELNATEAAYPDDQCLTDLFEAQAERTPGKIAVMAGDQSLTYAELNARANQLAQHLQTLGIGPEARVAICAERSIELVVGLLGILKAGGAYVPLDPTYPVERLAYMLEDSQATVLITQSHLLQTPKSQGPNPKDQGPRTICLDTDWPTIAQSQRDFQSAIHNPQSTNSPDNLAYLIYTSGSTGRPKGAMITHRGLVNYLTWCRKAYPLAGGQGAPVHSSISFDLTVTSLWAPLTHGGRALLLPETRGVDQLTETLRRETDFSLIKITPAHLQLLGEHFSAPEAAGRTRAFIIGGENLLADHLAFWQKHAPETALVNEYGPTETVVGCCVYSAPVERLAGSIPIGRPIINTQLYILDENLNPVGIGEPGELFIGGLGVGRGYWGRPDLTAEKFVPNPFAGMQEKAQGSRRKAQENAAHLSLEPYALRLYRTGDLARYLPDGNIEFLGRIDHQVKIRGFRIELGEIESTLAQHPGIQENVVSAREDKRGGRETSGENQSLVAYLVPKRGAAPNATELRNFLAEKLPEYMIPAAFVWLGRLPLTPNGKVDRRALPAPDSSRPNLGQAYLAPRTPVEIELAEIWSNVLGVEKIGREDNFFELGGHSLLATQIISRLRDSFQVEVPLSALLQFPTIAALAERLAGATPALSSAGMKISRRPADGSLLPLSFAQQRLWFLDQLEPNSAAYNIPLAMRLSGPLNASALEHSLNAIVQRHEALRTTFQVTAGRPQQVILPELTLPLTRTSLEQLPPVERDLEAQRLAREEARRPFNLAQGPLLRATLLSLSEQEHVLLLNLHHIVSDGWSMGVVIREITTLYAAALAGQTATLVTCPANFAGCSEVEGLPELPIQYADFARWQRDWLQGQILEEQLAYWKGHLSGAPALLDLPTDRPRPPMQTLSGAWLTFELSPTLSAQLLALSQQSGVTLFMMLLAAFNVLLGRYSGQDDIVVGSPIANRHRAEIEGLIGFFVNTLALRTRLNGDPNFLELLARVRETALGAYAHQDLPFELLVEHLQPKRDLSYSPVFQAMFNLENAPLGKLDIPGVTFQPLVFESQTAKYDLTLLMEQRGPQLFGVLEYNTDLFERATIARLLSHFRQVLESVVAQPDRRVAEISLVTDAEREQLLTEWNATEGDYPAQTSLHSLFEAQVTRMPHAIAVMDVNQRLTYQALNQRANQLAHHLQALGVRPEVPVGVCLERSAQTLVALLAILKAGGVYVPLDPSYPSEHLAFILADARMEVLITESRWLGARDGGLGISTDQTPITICLDADWETIANQQPAASRQLLTADSLSFIFYTSGSTGQPKGVAVSQRQLLNRFAWMWQAYPFAAEEVMCQRTTVNFSVSLWELLGALLQGTPTLIVEDEVMQDTTRLVAMLADYGVTRIGVVPSLLRVILDTDIDLQAALPRLKLWSTCGEPLTVELYRRFRERLPHATLLNQYGASEVNDMAWYDTHLQPVDDSALYVPIGRPILNTKFYVLDAHLQPVPVGIPGDVYVNSAGLARGYWGQPDLTAERFIPNPFLSKDEGGRMKDEDSFRLPPSSFILYKTGDRARYRPDGVLEYIGRVDNQVKIRGMRVELKGVEAILNQHPAVRQAAVLAREEDSSGEKRLVAYVVMDSADAPPIEELRRFLKTKLPDHLTPAVFVRLDALPLTPNGKVDRRALPEPDGARPDLGQAYVAPETDVERTVAVIWSEALKLERVGVHDNFFELGGHSLLIIQVHQRLQEAFPKRTITVVDLFKFPTLRDQARYLEQTHDEGASLQKSLERVERRTTALQNRRQLRGRR